MSQDSGISLIFLLSARTSDHPDEGWQTLAARPNRYYIDESTQNYKHDVVELGRQRFRAQGKKTLAAFRNKT